MKIRPLGTKLVVEVDPADEVTKGGIILPDEAKQEKEQGKVVAIGTGVDMELKENDKVLFGKYSGDDFEMDEVKYKIVEQDEVLAVIEK